MVDLAYFSRLQPGSPESCADVPTRVPEVSPGTKIRPKIIQKTSKIHPKINQKPFKIDPKNIQNPPKNRPKLIKINRNRSQGRFGSQAASRAVPGRLPYEWRVTKSRRFERKWRVQGSILGPGRFPKRPENRTFNIKINKIGKKSIREVFRKKHEKT